MSTIETATFTPEEELPKDELAPVVKELADTARTLLWELPGGFGSPGTTVKPEKEWDKPGIVTIGAKEYQASWQYKKEAEEEESEPKTKKGPHSHRIVFKSGDKTVALAYGYKELGRDKSGKNKIEFTGASVLYMEGDKRYINTQKAIIKAENFLAELIAHTPDRFKFPLPKTNRLLGRDQ